MERIIQSKEAERIIAILNRLKRITLKFRSYTFSTILTLMGCQNQEGGKGGMDTLASTGAPLNTTEGSNTPTTQANASTSIIETDSETTLAEETMGNIPEGCVNFCASCSNLLDFETEEQCIEWCRQQVTQDILCGNKFEKLLDCRGKENICGPEAVVFSNNCDKDGYNYLHCTDPTIMCGNGVIDVGEECDDENINDGDSCSECKTATVGDCFFHQGVEECEDGNIENGDGCNAEGKIEMGICGDGIKNISEGSLEECDDGEKNADENAKCKTDCTISENCGNGVLDVGEECDPKDPMEEISFTCTAGCRDWSHDKCAHEYPYNYVQ